MLELLTKLLLEMQGGESKKREDGENLSDSQSTNETTEDKTTNSSSQAALRLLDLVIKEKESRLRAKREKQRQEEAELRRLVLSCIRENGKIGWKDIAHMTDENTAEDIKRAIRALRRKGLIERVDGGGKGVSAVYDICSR
ncbi:MAG: hypothetical protein FVQ83_14075 [Chloroflexi bacterium]|nr:hypothetical protein [Chloroflexota bacterium]